MKIIKAAFSKTFPITQYYEKIYLEAELNDGDDARQVLYDLKKQVNTFFYESNAAAEKQMGTQVSDAPIAFGIMLDDIKSCKTLKVLESYKMVVKNKPDLQAAYDEQFKKLSQ